MLLVARISRKQATIGTFASRAPHPWNMRPSPRRQKHSYEFVRVTEPDLKPCSSGNHDARSALHVQNAVRKSRRETAASRKRKTPPEQIDYSTGMKRLRSLVACALTIGFVGATATACNVPDDSCAMSLCGCSADATMTFAATVQDASTMMPLTGIELVCFGETTPIAVSDATGKLSFSIQTQSSPGCGFARCNNMKLHDPSGARLDLEGTYFSFNEKTLAM